MGRVTAANVIYDDGTCMHFVDLEREKELSDIGRVEFLYAYDPYLLPPLGPTEDGMWRYRALLPIEGDIQYPLAVGGTPLFAPPQLRAILKTPELWLKDETRSPSGSNKDRATALVLEYALQHNVHVISCASTGNAALSLSIGAAAVGLQAVIFVPAEVSIAKLQLMLSTGAIVFKVQEGYAEAVRLSRQAAHAFNWHDRNTGYNPLTLEAKKTVALEIWEQSSYQVPDVIFVPVGDGVTLSGLAKGFRELIACGAVNRMPRIIGVQAEGHHPLKKAWDAQTQMQTTLTVPNASTIADGIAVTIPTNGAMALRDVRESEGSFLTVSDAAILQAISMLARKGGIMAEPAAAAAVAGIEVALTSGLINREEHIVALITGTGLKTPQYLQQGNFHHVYEIPADLRRVEQIIAQQLEDLI
jgi:threonine synthase